MTLNLEMLRLQIRCSPPRGHAPRSGAFVVDLHTIALKSGGGSERKGGARFSDHGIASSPPPRSRQAVSRKRLLSIDVQRLLLAVSLVSGDRASAILSLGPLAAKNEGLDAFGMGTSPRMPSLLAPLPARVEIGRSEGPSIISTVAVTVDIPSVHVDLSKPLLDGLQLWADDISQLVEMKFGESTSDTDTERADSKSPSLIGSRFFAKNKRQGSKSSVESSTLGTKASSETIVKVVILEGLSPLLHLIPTNSLCH